jgi:hypothetical protein
MTGTVEDYQAMTPKALRQVLLAEYRCRTKGCLLLHVWQTPHGRYWYLPPYDLSPEVTEAETVETARRKRTDDGYRKWKARGGSFDDLLESAREAPNYSHGLTVQCDHHVRGEIPAAELAARVNGATPGTPAKVFVPGDTPKRGAGTSI